MPEGSHVVIEFRQDGAVPRYFVMQRGAGWGDDYDEGRRTGDWQFQAYNADRSVKVTSDSARFRVAVPNASVAARNLPFVLFFQTAEPGPFADWQVSGISRRKRTLCVPAI